jgi:hypothetical protein
MEWIELQRDLSVKKYEDFADGTSKTIRINPDPSVIPCRVTKLNNNVLEVLHIYMWLNHKLQDTCVNRYLIFCNQQIYVNHNF